jgi:hypothetical protein
MLVGRRAAGSVSEKIRLLAHGGATEDLDVRGRCSARWVATRAPGGLSRGLMVCSKRRSGGV